MSDLTEIQSAGITKLIGSAADGTEQTPITSDVNGSLSTRVKTSAGGEALPPALGAQTSANSLSMTLASDQADIHTQVQTTDSVTYYAAAAPFTPANNTTDFFTISGSTTKTIKILKLILSATQTTAGINRFNLMRRSAANTGGTLVTVTPANADMNDPSASAALSYYTANPTALGASDGNVDIIRLVTPAVTGTIQPFYIWDFSNSNFVKPIILSGIAQSLVLNLNGTRPAGISIGVSVIWTEE